MAGRRVDFIWSTIRRRWWMPAIAAVLFAAYSLAGFLLVPYLAKNAIEDYVETDLARHVVIEGLTFNPFTFATEISGFILTEQDNEPLISFDFLRVDFQISSLFYRAWTFKEIALDNPNVSIVVEADNSLNLAKLSLPPSEPVPEVTPASLPALRISTLAVGGGRIDFEDRSLSEPFVTTLAPLSLSLNDFRTTPDFQNVFQFEATTIADEILTWAGQFSLQPLGSTGGFTIGGLKAATVASYLQDALPFSLSSGSLDLEGQYRIAIADELEIAVELPTLEVHEVGIAPKTGDDTAVWISVPEAILTGTTLMLPNRTLSIARIDVERPRLQVWREADGQINLSQLLPSSESEIGEDRAPTTGELPFSISVDTFSVNAASIEAEDRTTEPVANVLFEPVSFTVSDYKSKPETTLQVDANANINESGSFVAQGSVRLDPFVGQMSVNLDNIDLVPFQPYIHEATSLELLQGQVFADVELEINLSGESDQPKVELTGNLAVDNLATRDIALQQDLISWERLELNGLSYQQAPDALTIEEVRVLSPYGRVVISAEQTLNVVEVLRPLNATNPVTTSTQNLSSSDRMPLQIGRVVIEDGRLDFLDFFVEPNFVANIENLDGSVGGLSSDPNSRAEVDLTGSIGGYAPVDISGQVNLLSTATFSDTAMNFRNIELTTFNPYSGKYAGYNISQGKLSTELNYLVENRAVDLQHHIILDQLEFGEATDSEDAVPLPVQLAVALLKDRNGVIDIDLPVSGSLDDPEFSVGSIIWQAFTGLLTRVVTAPFALLGSLVSGGEELAIVEFSPGSAELLPNEAAKLESLATALVERPQLRLEIPLGTLVLADDTALSEAAYDEALASVVVPEAPEPSIWQRLSGPPEPPTQDEQRLAALTQLYEGEFDTPPEFPLPQAEESDFVAINVEFLENILRPQFSVTAAARDELARARAQAVQAAILANEGMMPERVFLTERSSGEADANIAQMELSLE